MQLPIKIEVPKILLHQKFPVISMVPFHLDRKSKKHLRKL